METSGDWLQHACGVKSIIKAASISVDIANSAPRSDSSILVGWAHYYDVIARFSLLHWRHRYNKQSEAHHSQPTLCYQTEVSSTISNLYVDD